MAGFAFATALLLAVAFVRAGAAKLARPALTAASFSDLGIPAPHVMAWAVPLSELALAVALVAAPVPGGVGAMVMLVAFTAVVVRALRAGVAAPCNCFGSARTEPVSVVDLVRNGLLLAMAASATLAARADAVTPASAIEAVAAFGAGAGLLRILRR